MGGGAARPDYVAELRVERGSHSLRFPCELFSERYPEYCFVYVSQAVNGAVSDVREECLPTLPILGKFLQDTHFLNRIFGSLLLLGLFSWIKEFDPSPIGDHFIARWLQYVTKYA